MWAHVLHSQAPIESAPLTWEETVACEPGPGEVCVRVECCAICRTDLHVIEGDLAPHRSPLIPGHQAVGIVDRVGERSRRFRVGQRIGIAWLGSSCQDCEFCGTQRENLCLRPTFTGYDKNGGMAEFTTVKEDFAYLIPESLDSVTAAPLLCAGIIGYRALQRSNFSRGRRLGIFGFGSSAHLVIQLALAQGGKVSVISRAAEHRVLALELGASEAVEVAEALSDPLDSAILFAPAGELVPSALLALKRGGTLAVAGIHLSAIPQLDYAKHLFQERDLRSVTANTRDDGTALFQAVERYGIRPFTAVYPFSAANIALLDLKRDRIRGTGVLVARL
ncbi:MAG: zinc-dependent alcohol dehydrogenase family protein [Bdellovibrionota bacterium]